MELLLTHLYTLNSYIAPQHGISTLSQEKIKNSVGPLKVIINDYNSDYNFLLNEARNSTMEIKTLRTLTLEIFKTLNNLKPLSDSNEIQIQNHLVRKRTLNHLAKLAKLKCSSMN